MAQHFDYGQGVDQSPSEAGPPFLNLAKHPRAAEPHFAFPLNPPPGRSFQSQGGSAGPQLLSSMPHNIGQFNAHAGYYASSPTQFISHNLDQWEPFHEEFHGSPEMHHSEVIRAPSPFPNGKGIYHEYAFEPSPYSTEHSKTLPHFDLTGDHPTSFQSMFTHLSPPPTSSPNQFPNPLSSSPDAHFSSISTNNRRPAASQIVHLNLVDNNPTIATLPSNDDDESRNWHFPKIVPRDHTAEINQYILECRQQNMPYKNIQLSIMEKFGWELKTPTLRTRMRTKIRKPNERLRNPVWTAEDVRILKDVVRFHVGERSRLARTKADVDRFGSIWKEVAEAHHENGASYAFAAATCKKRWMMESGIALSGKGKKKSGGRGGLAAKGAKHGRNRVSVSTMASEGTTGESSTFGTLGSEENSWDDLAWSDNDDVEFT